jgi:hypothetical protein
VLRHRTVLVAVAVGLLAVAGTVALTRGGGDAPSAASLHPSPAATAPSPGGTPVPSPSASPEATAPITVSGIVTVRPPSGWTVRYFFLHHDPPYLRLVRRQVRMNILAGPFDGSAPELAASYADRFVVPFSSDPSPSPSTHWIRLPSGVPALRLVYDGPFGPNGQPGVHELTVFRRGADGVVFDGWGAADRFAEARAELDGMVASARVV